VKRITPSAEVSCGPVKTSPDGMLRLPSEFTHVRPSTVSRRFVPSAWMWISRLGARRSISPAWKARSSPHAAAGSSRSRNSARVTKSSNSRVPMPACCAAAAVGHSVIDQRRPSMTSRSGARERAARDRRAGSTPASAFALSVAWMRREASISSASASSAVAKPSRCTSRAALQKPSSCPGSEARISGHASRSRISRCSASSSGEASTEDCTSTCWPGATSRQ
jgi:hypothetical protein